jgi:cytochrome P450
MNQQHPRGAVVDAPIVTGMEQLGNYDEIQEILQSRKFLQGQYPVSGTQMLRGTVTTLDGDAHLKRRRILARLFSDDRVAEQRRRYLVPMIEQCLAEAVAMGRAAGGVVRADLIPLVQRCLYRVAAAVTGIDGLESTVAADRLIAQVRDIATGITIDWTRDDPAAVLARAMAARNAFRDEFFLPSFEKRMKRVAEPGAPESADALTLILRHRQEAWQGDDELILREISLLLNASTQTTAIAFTALVMRLEKWLLEHPEDRDRIESEPEFLRRAAFESLRMTVSTPARIRIATEEVVLKSGRKIRAGEAVALLFLPANEDPARFGASGGQFDPGRSVADGTPPWGLSFGAGAHTCPGRPLVTGSRNPTGRIDVDGSLVSLARRFYGAGLALDPERPAVRDTGTHYEIYASVPIILSGSPGSSTNL